MRHNVLTKVLTDDEQLDAKTIQEQFTDDLQPQTLIEELLIETMAIAYTRKLRATHAEREFLLQGLNPPVFEEKVINPPPPMPSQLEPRLSLLRKATKQSYRMALLM